MRRKTTCAVMAGMMLATGLSLTAAAESERPEPIVIMNETETGSTEKNHSIGESHSFSSGNSIGSSGIGFSHGMSHSYGWSENTSVSNTDNESEDDGITFGWFDTEGFHVATENNLDRMDADNAKEHGLAKRTGRVYGWLDDEGFHPLDDMFNDDGTATDEIRRKMDEFRENYDHVRAEIEDMRNSIDETELLDELEEDIENISDDDDEGNEDYDDEYYDEDEDEDDDDEPFYDDEEDEDFYSDSLTSVINAIPGETAVSEADENADSLIKDQEPSWVIVEEDVFDSKNTSRSSSKGTVSGKEKSGHVNGASESNSFSTAFGAGESEGTGVVNGRRIYYIYDLRDDAEN